MPLTALADPVRVNSYTEDAQNDPDVLALSGGGVLVAWESFGQDGDANGVYLQRFDENGTPVGGEIQVNQSTEAWQSNPALADLGDGRTLIVYQNSEIQSGATEPYVIDDYNIWLVARIMREDGSFETDEFVLYRDDGYRLVYPEVAVLDDGTFVVVWENEPYGEDLYSIGARHFAPDGMPLGGSFSPPVAANTEPYAPYVTALEGGGFVISWSIFDRDAVQNESRFQLYDDDAQSIGARRLVSLDALSGDLGQTYTYQTEAVALSDGGFVLAGKFYRESDPDGGQGVFTQVFDASGGYRSGTIHTPEDNETFNRVTAVATPDGGYVLSYSPLIERETDSVVAIRFNAESIEVGSETQVSDPARTFAWHVSGDTTATGRLAFAWQTGDHDVPFDVYMRLYEAELYGTSQADMLHDLTGQQAFIGFEGQDTVSYAGAAGRVLLDFQSDVSGAGFARFFDEGAAAGDSYESIEHAIGSAFADNLRGDGAANRLEGGAVSDRLYGRAGDDTLDGGTGADALYGNLGADVMTGGPDGGRADRYIYFAAEESGVGAGNRDIITDFVSGEDRIELGRIDADISQGFKQRFDFIGEDAFSAAGQIRYEQAGGVTLVQADRDGDGSADFEIELSGQVDLTAGDFLI